MFNARGPHQPNSRWQTANYPHRITLHRVANLIGVDQAMLRGGEATVQRSATAILLVMFLGNGALLSAQETLHPLSGFEEGSEGADVLGAIADSLKLLLIEHGSRITLQEKTRRELGGNFW